MPIMTMNLTKIHSLRRWLPMVALALATSSANATPSAAREWNEQLLAAIRRNVPNPPGHARNLFHTAVAMYDAWAAYDPVPLGYAYNEKITPLPVNIEAARAEAISFAAYRVLRARFASPAAGFAQSLADFDAKIISLYGAGANTNGQGAVTNGTTPMEVGRRIGQAILTWGASDGFGITNYPQAYTTAVNGNMASALAMSVLGDNGETPSRPNMPLGFGLPLISLGYPNDTNPNLWQPLALSASVSQNGIPSPGSIQTFVGVQSMRTTPFSLTRTDALKPWVDPFGGPSKITVGGNISPTDAAFKAQVLGVIQASSQLDDIDPSHDVDISPLSTGNNPLGSDSGTGRLSNPVPGGPVYSPNIVHRGDFVRVLAEFWADGPNSETPPGHWHVLANQVSDNPLCPKKLRGVGATVNDLEWDIKTYFCVAASTHDAACAAWALKRYYSGPRPITLIRYMGARGQCSEPMGPAYHPEGLPLEAGVVEVVTPATYASGERHEFIWNMYTNTFDAGFYHDGEVVIRSWPAEHMDNLPAPSTATHQSHVTWMLAKDWVPFQRKTFNTPAFPGYISGHSTFSRASAEALTLLTGSPYFPGGFAHHTYAANSMQIDLGPSTNIDLQWCAYYDAADQAGQSRRWGGIHVSEDDYHGRIIGSQVGVSAFTLAEKYWTGTVDDEIFTPNIVILGPHSVKVTWNTIRGMYYKVRTSPNLQNWTDVAPLAITYDTIGSYTDNAANPEYKFYQVVRSTAP